MKAINHGEQIQQVITDQNLIQSTEFFSSACVAAIVAVGMT